MIQFLREDSYITRLFLDYEHYSIHKFPELLTSLPSRLTNDFQLTSVID